MLAESKIPRTTRIAVSFRNARDQPAECKVDGRRAPLSSIRPAYPARVSSANRSCGDPTATEVLAIDKNDMYEDATIGWNRCNSRKVGRCRAVDNTHLSKRAITSTEMSSLRADANQILLIIDIRVTRGAPAIVYQLKTRDSHLSDTSSPLAQPGRPCIRSRRPFPERCPCPARLACYCPASAFWW
jgi:hypothetical protein